MLTVNSRLLSAVLLITPLFLAGTPVHAQEFDLVIRNGRVMNPANGLDSVRDIGIRDGRIVELSREPLSGSQEVDASGLVVAPGFIDLHAHGQREFESWLQAQDGVTTQLEMEAGVYPVEAWYEQRAGTAPINYGATVGHIPVRIATMVDLESLGLTEDDLAAGLLNNPHFDAIAAQKNWAQDAATEEQINAIRERLQRGLDEGALGMGFGINYTAGATREEIYRMFEVASANDVTTFVHSRFMAEDELGGSVDAVQELLANAASTGAGLHIVHIGSSGGSRVPLLLEMIDSAQQQGIDVTTEVYPYTAWSTFIGAALFDGDFTQRLGLDYGDIELPESGERLNQERFEYLREQAPQTIIVGHGMQEDNVTAAVAHPGVMIASDGMFYNEGRAHPRGAGTFSRVLGYYVRERDALSLMEALGKMSYLPAKRLENAVPQMKRKGRIEIGADADLVVFDPERVADRATFAEPALPSEGIEHVLVNGIFVVREGEPQKDNTPGQAIRRERVVTGVVSPATQADTMHSGPVMNYHRIGEHLVTGGHFVDNGLSVLKAEGVEVVIDLRDKPPPGQKDRLAQQGIEWINVPIEWSDPKAADFTRFSEVMQEHQGDHVLVQCAANYRASAMTYLYRVVVEQDDENKAAEDLYAVWTPSEESQRWADYIEAIKASD